MSEIKNGGLDQYGVEPFKQQQFGTAGIERVKNNSSAQWDMADCDLCTIKTPMPKNLPQPVTSIKDYVPYLEQIYPRGLWADALNKIRL